MFEKLRNAFSLAAKSFGEKELKEKDVDEVLFELEVALLESDVATEVIDEIKEDLKKQLVGSTVNKDKIAETVKQELRRSISAMFDQAGSVDIVANIQKKKEKGEPYIISFMGINGTGKTTTIAKVANLLRESKYSVVIAAADTYRAGAIEQISEHGKRLNVKVIAQNYGSDPAAVARDAVLYAKSHKIDCILIDTAGRMQTSKNLMDQISKINKVVNPDLKLFVGDSLAGNDTVSQAREFHNYTKFDGAILTKSDADARGGAAISIVKVTSSPILYLGVGQEYGDLKPFDKEIFLETIFGPEEAEAVIKKVEQKPELKVEPPKVEPKPEPKVEPKIELPKVEPSKVEPKPEPKVELPKVEPPKVEPKPEPKVEPKIELPKVEPPKVDLKIEQPKVEQPKVEVPKIEHLKIEEPKVEPKVEQPKPEPPKIESKSKKEELDEDPFAGISTKDIEKYSDLFDEPPPENDDQARKLASDIRKWISAGRPKDKSKAELKQEPESEEEPEGEQKAKDEKPKKRSLFGWMKK